MTKSKVLSAILAVIFALGLTSASFAAYAIPDIEDLPGAPVTEPITTVPNTPTTNNNTDATFFIITDTLADGTVNQSYTQRLRATVSGVSWVVAGGALPDGLRLNSSTGEISGTPTRASSYQFTISASNGQWADSRAFAITIGQEVIPVKITRESLNPGTVGSPYADVITANVTGVTFTRQSGSLPNGLTMDDAGVITGTPTATGTSRFIVSATNGETSDIKEFTITIANDPIVIRTNILTNGTLNQTYAGELIANKTTGVTWQRVNGELPTGLSLAASTGRITGTPTATGIYEFTVSASDGTTRATRSYTVEITPPTVIVISNDAGEESTVNFEIINEERLPDATVGTPYSGVTFQARPSGISVSWAIMNNAAPGGLSLSDTGVLTGNPNTAGTFFFEVQAKSGSNTARKTFRLTINPEGGSLAITSSRELRAEVDKEYRTQLTATVANARWTVTGLPAGLTYNPETGVITGTPTVPSTYTLTVTATANGQSVNATVTMIVYAPSNDDDDDSGCNSGIGIFSLAVLALLTRKSKK